MGSRSPQLLSARVSVRVAVRLKGLDHDLVCLNIRQARVGARAAHQALEEAVVHLLQQLVIAALHRPGAPLKLSRALKYR